MFLKEIETRPPEGMMQVAFKKMRESGHAVPEIMHLFRFKKRNTDHLVRFTEEVMRGPSPLSRGLRELIGAFISTRNQCCFCGCAHGAVAAQLMGKELVDDVLLDPENSRLDLAHKELFRYIGKLAENPALVTASDTDKLKAAGWSEEAIYDALTVASLFKFYNTWNNGSGVQTMTSADNLHSGERLVTVGYCMDFSLKWILKIVWLCRKEISYSDLKGLIRSIWPARQGLNYAPTTTPGTARNGVCLPANLSPSSPQRSCQAAKEPRSTGGKRLKASARSLPQPVL